MITVFGRQSQRPDSNFPAAADDDDVPDPAKNQCPMFVPSSLHQKSKSADAPASTMQPHVDDTNLNSTPLSTSRLMKLSRVLKKLLIYSRSQCLNRRITKANQEMTAAIKESGEGGLNLRRYLCCEDAARKMEVLLFSVGGAERVVKTLQYFKDRTAVEELTLASRAMVVAGDTDTEKYLSKDKKLSAIVMDNLKGMFSSKRGETDKGGGQRNLEDQNAYDAVMASLISKELDATKVTKLLSQKFWYN